MNLVTIYENPDFRGRGIPLDVGDHRRVDTPIVVSSIQVPAGLGAKVYEHADSGGGYGISAEFLEDCADLAPLGLKDNISYISVFSVAEQRPGFVWRRGAIRPDGEYVPGHWERKQVVESPPNPFVPVPPPVPPPAGSQGHQARDHRRPVPPPTVPDDTGGFGGPGTTVRDHRR